LNGIAEINKKDRRRERKTSFARSVGVGEEKETRLSVYSQLAKKGGTEKR